MSYETGEGLRPNAEATSSRFDGIVRSHLLRIVSERVRFIGTIPVENSVDRDTIPEVGIYDERISYLGELLVVLEAITGFDASEQFVTHLEKELETLDRQYSTSSLLAIQCDVIDILEEYSVSS